MMEENKQGRPRKYDDPKAAQREANRRYREKNQEKIRYQRKRSAAKSFVMHDAMLEDLEELASLIQQRIDNL